MTLVTLDGNNMLQKDDVHAYLQSKLKLPDYYGKNLDALWDVLSSLHEPIEIHFMNTTEMLKQLGNYGASLVEVFEDAAKENSNIKFKIIS